MPSLTVRHSRRCAAYQGAACTVSPENEKIPPRNGKACDCRRPSYSIRYHTEDGLVYVNAGRERAPANALYYEIDKKIHPASTTQVIGKTKRPTRKRDLYIARSLLSPNLIKIGVSHHVRKRMKDLYASAIVVLPEAADRETEFHVRFLDQHQHGEWFREEGELAEYIALVTGARTETTSIAYEAAPDSNGRTPEQALNRFR